MIGRNRHHRARRRHLELATLFYERLFEMDPAVRRGTLATVMIAAAEEPIEAAA